MNGRRQGRKQTRIGLWQPVDTRPGRERAAFNHKGDAMEQLVQSKADCILSCQYAYGACMKALARCLQLEHARLLLDCAESCQVSAAFLLRESPSAGSFCSLSARLCDRCVEECERLPGMDECVQACRRAAALCHVIEKVPSQGI